MSADDPETPPSAAPLLTAADLEAFRETARQWIAEPSRMEQALYEDLLVGYQVTRKIAGAPLEGTEGARITLQAWRDVRGMATTLLVEGAEIDDDGGDEEEDGTRKARPRAGNATPRRPRKS